MKLYPFAVLTILALTVGPIPQTDAGFLHGLIHDVGSIAGGIKNTVENGVASAVINKILDGGANMKLGDDLLSPGSKIVTIGCSDGKVIGHATGKLISTVEQFVTMVGGGNVRVKVLNNNGSKELQVLKTTGELIITLPNFMNIADIALQCDGEMTATVNTLGEVVNGAQSILDKNGNVIGQVAQDSVHAVGSGAIVIVGDNLWGIFKKLLPKLVGPAFTLIHGVRDDIKGSGATIKLGDATLSPGSKIVSIVCSDGKVIGHVAGTFMSFLEQLVTKYGGGDIRLVRNNDSKQVEVINTSGEILTNLPKSLKNIHTVLQCDGEITLSVNTLGKVDNGAQSILDKSGNVIGQVTQDSVHAIRGGTITIFGDTLWGLTRGFLKKLLKSIP